MKIFSALQKFSSEADMIVGKERNAGKRGHVYAATHQTVAALKPLAAKHGLSIHVIPAEFSGSALQGDLREVAGAQAMRIIVTHESGEMHDFGVCSMPVNIANKGLSSADKSLIAFTLLTRKVWLGLAGVVEVDSEEKTFAAQDADEALFAEAAKSIESAETVEKMREIYKSYAESLSTDSRARLTAMASKLKEKFNAE